MLSAKRTETTRGSSIRSDQDDGRVEAEPCAIMPIGRHWSWPPAANAAGLAANRAELKHRHLPIARITHRFTPTLITDHRDPIMSAKDHLIIFDTTLRDGEQSPGASMTRDEKVRIAKALEKLRVDVIEAGFPIASPGDFEAVKAVAETIKDSRVCGLARALDADIDRAGEALRHANAGRIHTFIATSPIHMEKKLRMTPDQVLERAVYAVKRARNLIDDVEFSPEDAGRSEIDFLCRVLEAVIDAGARTVNIPDTVGYNIPDQFGALIATLRARIPNADKAIFSVHCHNDLGLATANSLAAVRNGARQVECTINGLGERAGTRRWKRS
jgi:2-isopropylmalate synthase (EC 2.3.3.13)